MLNKQIKLAMVGDENKIFAFKQIIKIISINVKSSVVTEIESEIWRKLLNNTGAVIELNIEEKLKND